MKTPTTPYSIAVQEHMQINRQFLESEGWRLKEEAPLFETFVHSKNSNLFCTIGFFGGLSIVELHWMNQTPETQFSTCNPDLTIDDYRNIIRYLNIKNITIKTVQFH